MATVSATSVSSSARFLPPEPSANGCILNELITDDINISTHNDGMHRILLRPFNLINVSAEKLVGYLGALDFDAFFDEIEAIQARRELLVHDVKSKQCILDDLFLQNPELKNKVLSSDVREKTFLEQVKLKENYGVFLPSISKFDGFSTLSSKEINELLSSAIGEMSKSYLDVFQQAVEKNTQFYKDFSDFMSTLPQFISADGDKTILDGKAFKESLKKLMDKYPVPDVSTTLFPVQTGSTVQGAKSREECEAWAKEFGLSTDDCIYQLPDGTYIVHIDISPLKNIDKSVKNIDKSVKNKKMTFNAAQWSAWQTGVDMQKDHIQNSMQTLTQKFANAHSTFDNLVKVLSSTIASLLECDKQFFV